MNQVLSNYHVAASVHTFHLLCGKSMLTDSTTRRLISKILHRPRHIQTFRFDGIYLAFSCFPRNISSAIQALCKSPNLITLELCEIDPLPITVITACPNLRCVHLDSVRLILDNVNPMDETSSLLAAFLPGLPQDGYVQIFNFECDEGLRLGWDMILLASQSLTTLDPFGVNGYTGWDFSYLSFDLGRLPALRHFKVQLPTEPYQLSMLSFLNRLLSISSSTSGLETLELLITSRYNAEDPDDHAVLELFSSSAEWDTLDEVLAEKFVSLGKFVLGWDLEVTDDSRRSSLAEYQNLALSYVNYLFPKLRRGQCTLETQFTVFYSNTLPTLNYQPLQY